MVGFGLVYGGVNAVFWSSLARVSSSWVISPLMGAAVSFLVYKCIRRVSTVLILFATCKMKKQEIIAKYVVSQIPY
jgi:phosphate/sulfate permease